MSRQTFTLTLSPKGEDGLSFAARVDVLPFERGEGPVHDDRGHAGVGDVFLSAIADAVLPGLGGERKSNEKQEGKDCANHEMSRVKAVRRLP